MPMLLDCADLEHETAVPGRPAGGTPLVRHGWPPKVALCPKSRQIAPAESPVDKRPGLQRAISICLAGTIGAPPLSRASAQPINKGRWTRFPSRARPSMWRSRRTSFAAPWPAAATAVPRRATRPGCARSSPGAWPGSAKACRCRPCFRPRAAPWLVPARWARRPWLTTLTTRSWPGPAATTTTASLTSATSWMHWQAPILSWALSCRPASSATCMARGGPTSASMSMRCGCCATCAWAPAPTARTSRACCRTLCCQRRRSRARSTTTARCA